jgi:ribosomal protein L7/L12
MIPLLAILEVNDFLIIAGIVLSFTAGRSLFAARRPDNSRRLERKLDALLKHHGLELPSGMSFDVQQLARNPALKIAAIKLHREDHPGLGLAEAKAEIEAFIKRAK